MTSILSKYKDVFKTYFPNYIYLTINIDDNTLILYNLLTAIDNNKEINIEDKIMINNNDLNINIDENNIIKFDEIDFTTIQTNYMKFVEKIGYLIEKIQYKHTEKRIRLDDESKNIITYKNVIEILCYNITNSDFYKQIMKNRNIETCNDMLIHVLECIITQQYAEFFKNINNSYVKTAIKILENIENIEDTNIKNLKILLNDRIFKNFHIKNLEKINLNKIVEICAYIVHRNQVEEFGKRSRKTHKKKNHKKYKKCRSKK